MKINVNGRVQDAEEARISVLDHGFLFGDSVYEVLRVRNGILENYDEHFARLQASAEFIACRSRTIPLSTSARFAGPAAPWEHPRRPCAGLSPGEWGRCR